MAKRYDDDDRGKDIGSRPLLAVATMAAGALLPQTSRFQMTKKRHGAKIFAALSRVEPDGYGAP